VKTKMTIKNQKGASAVEFAIIAPLLFVLLFGIVEGGLALYNKAVITNACREGARDGIVLRSPQLNQA
jgi:Flp pilus assembly protein TadG